MTESGALGGTYDPIPTPAPPSFPVLTWLNDLESLAKKAALRPGSQTLGLLEGPAGLSCLDLNLKTHGTMADG